MTVVANIPNNRPIMMMDFANSGGVSPLMSCVRPSVASYINSDGFLRFAQPNTPRITHDPVTLACLGLLVEDTQSNLFTYSDDATNAIWLKTGATTGTTGSVGNMPTVTLTESTASSEHSIRRAFGNLVTAGDNVTFQIFLKQDITRFVVCEIRCSDGLKSSIKLDLQTGDWLPGAATMPTVTWSTIKHRSGLVQVIALAETLQAPIDVDNNCAFKVALSKATSLAAVETAPPIYTGTTGSILVGGIQLAKSKIQGSYIQTGATPVTRAADVIKMDGLRIPSEYTVITDHTLASVIPPYSTLYTLLSDTPDYTLRMVCTSTGNTRPQQDAIVFNGLNIPSMATQLRRRTGFAINGKTMQTALNGTLSPVQTITAKTDLTVTLLIGQDRGNVNTFSGTINRILIYPVAMAPNQLTQATYIHS